MGTRRTMIMLLVLLGGVLAPVKAQTWSRGDAPVISVVSTVETNGQAGERDSDHRDIYVIDMGTYNAETGDYEGARKYSFDLCLDKAVDYPVSVELSGHGMDQYASLTLEVKRTESDAYDAVKVVTFAPGETRKTIYVSDIYPSMFPIVGRRPVYVELLFPSRATLDVNLVEMVFDFNSPPGEDSTFSESYNTIGGNYAVPLMTQDSYGFLFMQPHNDETGKDAYVRVNQDTRYSFTVGNVDFDALDEELPTALPSTTHVVGFVPRQQQNTRSSSFAVVHRFNQGECVRDRREYSTEVGAGSTREFTLMSSVSSAGPFFSAGSTDDTAPTTLTADDITAYEGENTRFELVHAVPYIYNVSTSEQSYTTGQQMDVHFMIDNWRFCYTFYKETLLQQLFVTFDHGVTRLPLTSATMSNGMVTASVKAPAEAGSYCLEIGVAVNDYTDGDQVATQDYYPATAFTNVTVAAGTAAFVPIGQMHIAGVPDVIHYTTEDTHRSYQAYAAITPVTATCQTGTWSIARRDGEEDDLLGIDSDGRLTFRAENIGLWSFEYGFAKSGEVTITFVSDEFQYRIAKGESPDVADYTLTKKVTLLPAVPSGITFYYDDQQQDVYGLSRDVVVDYQFEADETWSLATEGTTNMTVTAKDGVTRTLEGIDVGKLQSERKDGVLHVYVPLTLNDHEYSLLERHGKSSQLVWTVKTDISLPFTNSISHTDYTLATFRYINYAYDPVRVDAWAKTSSPVYSDIVKGQTDYVVTHAYNLPKDAYFMVHWDIKSDEKWDGHSSYNYTNKRQETWESTQGMDAKPDWLQLLDRGDGYYDAKIIVPVETEDCEGEMMPVVISTGASSEAGENGYGDYGVSSYRHYTVFGKDDFKTYVARPYSTLDDTTLELTDGSTPQLSDEAQMAAFSSALTDDSKDLFDAIASVRKGNILAISNAFEGETNSYAGHWAARETQIIVTGGKLGGDTIRLNNSEGGYLYFPIADATYKIEVVNETFGAHRTFSYTTHDLKQKKNLYVYYSMAEAYMQNAQAEQFVLPQFVDFVYTTKSGETKTIHHKEKKTQWFYEPDDIVGFFLLNDKNEVVYNSLNYYHASIDNYTRPFFTASVFPSAGSYSSFLEGRSNMIDEIEDRNPVIRNVIYEEDGNIHLSLHNIMGEAVTKAHVNYVAVDGEGRPADGHASAQVGADGRVELPFRTVVTAPLTSSLYLEVVAEGYEPKFYKYNATSQSYRHSFSAQPTNEVDLVLERADEAISKICRADLMSIVEANADTTAVTFAITDLTGYNLVDKVSYKEGGPLGGPKSIYAIQNTQGVYGFVKRWEGEKFLQLDLTFRKEDAAQDYSKMTLSGFGNKKDVEPTQWQEIKMTDTGFEHDYIDATFNLVDFVPNEKMAIPMLKVGLADFAQLPKLHNEELDIDSIARNTDIKIRTNPTFNPADIGTESKKRDCDLGEDNQELFNEIDFDFPEVMGFQFQVKKVGNHFQVRGVYSKNFLPGGDEADMMDSFTEEMMDYANQFDKVFKDCVDACTGGSGGDEDFDFLYGNDPLFAKNDAFIGIRAFISGVAYIGPKGEFMMNFHDGGIKLEMSGEYTHKCSFGIGSFGAKLSGELSTQLKLINHKAAAGDVYNFSLNVMVENEVRAEIVAWATAGLNILNLVKAEVGVRGGVSATYQSGISYPLVGNAGSNSVYGGHKLSLRSGMFIYADARFLWWKKHWEKWFFKYSKDFCWPDDSSNPYSDSFVYGPSLFSVKAIGGREWRKVKPRRVVGLGQTLMNDVSGLASPRLFNGGTSIIYNKLNDATDYNDDRLMMRTIAGGADTDINPQATGAAFAFDVAERGDKGIAAFEQYRTSDLSTQDVEGSTSMDAMNEMSCNVDVVASLWNGSSWQSTNVSQLSTLNSPQANLSPRVAVQDDGKAAVVWLSGTPMATAADSDEDRQQYLVGSYMLSRYDGEQWSEPIELAKLNQSFIVSDHRMVMHGDSLLIIMEHQDEISSEDNPYIDYICVTPKNAVSMQMGVERGRNPQVVRMGDVNMVGYLTERPDSTQDIRLRSVDMANSPVATTDAYARLGKRSVNAFKLTATEDAASLDDLALVWTQSVLNPATNEADSWLCAGRFGKSGSQLYVSYPEQVVRIPDDFTASAFDGYIDQDNLHVVYTLSDVDNDGTAVIQKDVKFTNAIRVKDCVITAANATNSGQIPFKLSVQNTGYAPVTTITAEIGSTAVEFTDLNLLPGETADLSGYFAINPGNYDGREEMEVMAWFGNMSARLAPRRSLAQNSSMPEMPRLVQRSIMPRHEAAARRAARGAATDPTMTATATLDCQVQATDLSCTVVNNRIRDTRNTIIAKVTNCSPLPLLEGQTVTVGLYASTVDTEPMAGTSLVTIPTGELYAGGKPLSKVVRLQADDLPEDQQVFIKVVVSDAEGNVVTDVQPENNHVPVMLYAQDGNVMTLLGDANGNGDVNMADAVAVVDYILGRLSGKFLVNAADVNFNGEITISDAVGIVKIILSGRTNK